jgi:hypothetical protein
VETAQTTQRDVEMPEVGIPYEEYVFPVLEPGMRVRLRAPTWGLTLRADTGTVVEPTESDGYYVIRLDQPALYDHGTGPPEELIEVIETSDNVDVLDQHEGR